MANLVRKLGELDRKLGKHQIVHLARENAQSVIQGGKYDLLKVYIELKRYETYLKTLILQIKNSAYQKAEEVRKEETQPNTFRYSDAKVRVTSRVKWDFSNDPEWSKLNADIRHLTEQKKVREKYLMKFLSEDKKVDTETGEVIEVSKFPKEIQYGLAINL